MKTRTLVRRIAGPVLGAGAGYLVHYAAVCNRNS